MQHQAGGDHGRQEARLEIWGREVASQLRHCISCLPSCLDPLLFHSGSVFNDVFVCTGIFDPSKPGVVAAAPSTLVAKKPEEAAAAGSKAKGEWRWWFQPPNIVSQGQYLESNSQILTLFLIKGKGKGKVAAAPAAGSSDCAAVDEVEQRDVFEEESAVAMASMDIFAGCGGLSEGMHQAGVAVSK